MSYKRECYQKSRDSMRPDYKYELRIGLTFDYVFFTLVIVIIIKLVLMLVNLYH